MKNKWTGGGGHLTITYEVKEVHTGIFLKIQDDTLGLYYLHSRLTLSNSTCHFNYILKSNLTYYFVHLGSNVFWKRVPKI
jgi:hypothetical protein